MRKSVRLVFIACCLSLFVALKASLMPNSSSLFAQSETKKGGPSPQKPLFQRQKNIDKGKVLDFLPPVPNLRRLDQQGPAFSRRHRRYLERSWQHLYEEGHQDILLEQALLDQFGSKGFHKDLGKHPYHESPGRRFQIVFTLSLPFSLLYSYALVSLIKSASNSRQSQLNAVEAGSIAASALGFSAWIGWQDYKKVQSQKAQQETGLDNASFHGSRASKGSAALLIQVQQSF